MSGPEKDQQHDAAWKRQLAALGREEPLNPRLMDQAVARLREAGHLHTGENRRRVWRMLMPLAAAILLVLAGIWLGRRAAQGGPLPVGERWALLLVEDSSFHATQIGEDSLVQEYSAWAGALARRGELILGEKLGDDQVALGSVPDASARETGRIAGFFVVIAPDRAAALELARSCPHLRYGGGILVRRIVPT